MLLLETVSRFSSAVSYLLEDFLFRLGSVAFPAMFLLPFSRAGWEGSTTFFVVSFLVAASKAFTIFLVYFLFCDGSEGESTRFFVAFFGIGGKSGSIVLNSGDKRFGERETKRRKRAVGWVVVQFGNHRYDRRKRRRLYLNGMVEAKLISSPEDTSLSFLRFNLLSFCRRNLLGNLRQQFVVGNQPSSMKVPEVVLVKVLPSHEIFFREGLLHTLQLQ